MLFFVTFSLLNLVHKLALRYSVHTDRYSYTF